MEWPPTQTGIAKLQPVCIPIFFQQLFSVPFIRSGIRSPSEVFFPFPPNKNRIRSGEKAQRNRFFRQLLSALPLTALVNAGIKIRGRSQSRATNLPSGSSAGTFPSVCSLTAHQHMIGTPLRMPACPQADNWLQQSEPVPLSLKPIPKIPAAKQPFITPPPRTPPAFANRSLHTRASVIDRPIKPRATCPYCGCMPRAPPPFFSIAAALALPLCQIPSVPATRPFPGAELSPHQSPNTFFSNSLPPAACRQRRPPIQTGVTPSRPARLRPPAPKHMPGFQPAPARVDISPQ